MYYSTYYSTYCSHMLCVVWKILFRSVSGIWLWFLSLQRPNETQEKEGRSLCLIKSWPTPAARLSNTTELGECTCLSVHLSVWWSVCLSHTSVCLSVHRPSFADRKRLGMDRKRPGNSRWVWPFLCWELPQRYSTEQRCLTLSFFLLYLSGSRRRSEHKERDCLLELQLCLHEFLIPSSHFVCTSVCCFVA